jgi:hypothetical protein
MGLGKACLTAHDEDRLIFTPKFRQFFVGRVICFERKKSNPFQKQQNSQSKLHL